MKRLAVVCVIVLVLAAGAGLFLFRQHGGGAAAPAEDEKAKPNEEPTSGARITRDAKGNVVVTLTDSQRGSMGLQLTNPAPLQMSPEVKGYGRVLDPGPLAGLASELAAAQAALVASSNELARLKTLEGQGNASARSLQAAQAAAVRDQLALQAAHDRLALSWSKDLAGQKDLPGFIQSLVGLEAALVRIDLPLGRDLKMPGSARLVTPSGGMAEAEFIGLAPVVDPEMQGRGFLFRVKPNALRLLPGEALVGYLQVPGPPLAGMVIPRDAVVRTEGAGWVYVSTGKAFVRTQVELDRPIEAGWFVTQGLAASNQVVVTGAQELLSAERKGGGEE